MARHKHVAWPCGMVLFSEWMRKIFWMLAQGLGNAWRGVGCVSPAHCTVPPALPACLLPAVFACAPCGFADHAVFTVYYPAAPSCVFYYTLDGTPDSARLLPPTTCARFTHHTRRYVVHRTPCLPGSRGPFFTPLRTTTYHRHAF